MSKVIYPPQYHERWVVGDVECIQCGYKWSFTAEQNSPVELSCKNCEEKEVSSARRND